MNKLNCKLIYSLRSGNIYAFDQDVIKLKIEFKIIADNISYISAETGYDIDFIKFRVDNALAIIEVVEHNFEKVGVAIE